MAFWGIEVKPGEPYIHQYDDERGRLHLSQATIIPGSSKKRTVVQCSVGDEKPIQLCSLLPEKLETCTLNLEFEEDNNVTFSVLGPHSVHLSGFFYGCDDEDQDNSEDEYLNNLYGEDIMVTDSEDKDYSEDEDEHGDCSDDDCCLYHSPVRKSGVRIEEIVEEKPTNENGISKRAKKKKGQLSMSNDIVKTRAGVPILESEDEDGFPKSSRQSKSDDTENDRIGVEIQKQDKDHKAQVKISKRKIDDVGQDGEFTRENKEPHDPVQPDTVIPENEVKRKKKNKNKKKKVAEKEENAQESGMLNSNGMEQSPVAEIKNDLNPISKEKKEKTKKPNKKGSAATPITEEKSTDKKGSVIKKQNKAEEANKSLQVRSFPNGLEIEELAMGKPDGKRASPGKKVSVHYIGKLKKNNKTFDSNIGRAPFKFRLGIGEVIKGWDVGVNGMRLGDKRRLTIPPAMGYGAKGCGPAIPPNSWLVFQVELVDVN